jgi:hypothetical protein
MSRNTSMQYEFDKEIFTAKDTVLVCFAVPNMIYFIAMLFGCIMPVGVTIGFAASISVWVTLVELSKSAYIFQSSGWRSAAALLKFYPTRKSTIRLSRYTIILRSMLLELILTAIPMIMFFYYFDPFQFLAALFTVAVTMSLVSIVGIELSMAAEL